MTTLLLVLFVIGATWTAGGLAALAATVRRGAPSGRGGAAPPVTVLKPLCGADPALEANLESFFVQDHPAYEIVLGAEDPDDPALALARRVVARHPGVRARVVVSRGGAGRNPKVRNLRGLLRHARHDHVLISDSNVRARPWTVREMAARADAHDVGVVTSPIAGAHPTSWAGALDAVQLCGFVAAGAALPTLLGDSIVIGKSMLVRRSVLERLGGLERMADVLAEDHVLGKTFEHAGLRVVIGAALALAWARDVGGWLILRGPRDLHVPLLLAPARDLLGLAAWAMAPLRRHVRWRGHRLRVGAGTLLFDVTTPQVRETVTVGAAGEW